MHHVIYLLVRLNLIIYKSYLSHLNMYESFIIYLLLHLLYLRIHNISHKESILSKIHSFCTIANVFNTLISLIFLDISYKLDLISYYSIFLLSHKHSRKIISPFYNSAFRWSFLPASLIKYLED